MKNTARKEREMNLKKEDVELIKGLLLQYQTWSEDDGLDVTETTEIDTKVNRILSVLDELKGDNDG